MHREHIKQLPDFENQTPVSARIRLALEIAAWAHEHKYRKLGHKQTAESQEAKIPYIIHPYTVLHILSEVTDDEDILIAGLLHDTIEDVPDRLNYLDICEVFGKRVADMVRDVTKNDDIDDWQKRNDNYLQHLRYSGSEGALMVCAADKVHNIMNIMQEYDSFGNELWEHFNAGRIQQHWWYQSVYYLLLDRLPNCPLTHQLGELVALLEVQQGIGDRQSD